MNKIKDLLYDKNDILVALLILGIAALVILTRVNTIMAFPEKMFSEHKPASGHVYSNIPQNPDSGLSLEDEDDGLGLDPDDDATGPSSGDEPEAHSLYIAYGQPMTVIAKNLIELGFFESEQDFTATLEAHKAASKVQAGNFVIPADSTKDDVIKIITGVAR